MNDVKPDGEIGEVVHRSPQRIEHCSATPVCFKMPEAVIFVDALPKNPSGKLLKRELRLAREKLFA